MKTAEQHVKEMLGEKDFVIATLLAKLEQAQEKIAELTKAKPE